MYSHVKSRVQTSLPGPETTSYSSTMDADGQARVGRVGRSVGVPNYRNDILINVVEEYFPQGLKAWRGAAIAKSEEVVADALSSETTKQQSTNS